MMSSRVFITILGMLLVFVWALFKLVLMCSLHLHVNNLLIHAQRKLFGHSGNWVTNALTIAAALGTFGSSLTHTLPHAGLVITFDASDVLMAVTTSARSWNDCSTFERMQRRLTRTGIGDGFFSSGPPCPCALHVSYSHVFLLLSGFLPGLLFSLQVMDRLS